MTSFNCAVQKFDETFFATFSFRAVWCDIPRPLGFNYFVDLHIELDPEISVAEGHRISHLVKDKLLAIGLNIKDVLIHIEPHMA
jgi:hypothetical protein